MFSPGDLQIRLKQLSGENSGIRSRKTVSGGSINRCQILMLENGTEIFLKTHGQQVLPAVYRQEFEALRLLREHSPLLIPMPLAWHEDFLLLEIFHHGQPASDWQEQLGRGLAVLHRSSQRNNFGYHEDNYLGYSRQYNTWSDNWVDFWLECRLQPQLRQWMQQAGSDDPLSKALTKLARHVHEFIGEFEDEPGVLLHGDLWSGNAAADTRGRPVLFDPAVYYGHREAEFGMMRMFGGFGPRCEAAYQEVWPLAPDSDRRISLYRLYHELNHLLLFGRAYYSSSLELAKGLLKSVG